MTGHFLLSLVAAGAVPTVTNTYDMAQKLATNLGEVAGFCYYYVDKGLPFDRRVVVWMLETQN